MESIEAPDTSIGTENKNIKELCKQRKQDIKRVRRRRATGKSSSEEEQDQEEDQGQEEENKENKNTQNGTILNGNKPDTSPIKQNSPSPSKKLKRVGMNKRDESDTEANENVDPQIHEQVFGDESNSNLQNGCVVLNMDDLEEEVEC